MTFAQLVGPLVSHTLTLSKVIGPPGSGKSTYCQAMKTFLGQTGRNVIICNLDPANDQCECDVDLRDLISVADVAERMRLGPNGSLMYCMEYLADNYDWLKEQLASAAKTDDAGSGDAYVLFDCPGQVELYTHHQAMRQLTDKLQNEWNYRLCAVHLVDSHHCNDPGKFVSILLMSLSTMLQLELPHVNVLSKIDLVEAYGKLAFNLDFYTDVMDLSYLLEQISDDPFAQRYKALTAALVELVEGFSLVGFHTLSINDAESVSRLALAVDKASGYVSTGSAHGNGEFSLLTAAYEANPEHLSDTFLSQEKYMQSGMADDEPWS